MRKSFILHLYLLSLTRVFDLGPSLSQLVGLHVSLKGSVVNSTQSRRTVALRDLCELPTHNSLDGNMPDAWDDS